MKKIRFGVIGTNNISTKVMAAAKIDPRFELIAVYSRNQNTADEFAKKNNVKHTFTDLEQMASSDLIDAVYVASPNSLHAEQSILCMQHGKHVLCEKPFASNVKEVKAMIEASHKYKVTLMEAMKPPVTPNFKRIIEESKKIGTIRNYVSTYCQYSSRYDDLKNGIIQNAFRLDLSNGAAMDIGVYTIYPMVVLFGRPNKINATGIKLSTGVDGQGVVVFEYDNMTATAIYSKIADSQLPTEIQGEKATIISRRINYIDTVRRVAKDGQEDTLISKEQENEYYYEIAEFIDLILAGERESTILSHENSLITMEIIDEIRKQLNIVYPADKK